MWVADEKQKMLIGAALLVNLCSCGSNANPGRQRSPARQPLTASPARTSLSIDATASRGVQARVVGRRLLADATVQGKGTPLQTVRVSSSCESIRCRSTVRVDGKGRWNADIRVSSTVSRPYSRLVAEGGDLVALGLVRLRRPRPAPSATRAAAPSSTSEKPSDPTGAGPSPEAEALDGLDGAGDVLVVGDSLEVLSAPYLHRFLPSTRFTINVKGGFSSIQIYRLFRQSFRRSHSVIVFDAGTNDNPAYPQILAGRLQAVAAAVGNRCMVVPSIHGLVVNGRGSAAKNRVVRSFAAARPGTQTPDWAHVVATRPDLMQSDGLHPVAAGAQVRAQLIAEGVSECLNGGG